MLKPGNYLCKNSDCPNYKENKLVAIGSNERFVCPLQLPNCESQSLEPAGQQPGKLARLWRILALLALLVVCVGAAYFLLRPKPRPRDIVVLSDGGVLLNALLVNIPAWIGDTFRTNESSRLLHFGLWGCRPREQDGERRVANLNFTPGLLPLAQFQALKVPAAPSPQDLTEEQRKSEDVAFDMLGDIKQAIENTQWTPKAKKNIVIVTASSGYSADDVGNSGKVSPERVRALAAERQVEIFAIQVLLPYTELAADQHKAETQLKALAENGVEVEYYSVSPGISAADKKAVTNYEASFKQAVSDVLKRILQ